MDLGVNQTHFLSLIASRQLPTLPEPARTQPRKNPCLLICMTRHDGWRVAEHSAANDIRRLRRLSRQNVLIYEMGPAGYEEGGLCFGRGCFGRPTY